MSPDTYQQTSIIIQPDLDAPQGEMGFYAHIKNGTLVDLRGMGGITQPEDDIGILREAENSVRWQPFLWSHYLALRLILNAGCDTEILFEGTTGRKSTVKLLDISEKAVRVPTGESGILNVALFDPVVDGDLSISPSAVEAGSRESFEVVFEAGESGIATGGGIRIMTPYSCWSGPYFGPDTVKVESAEPVKFYACLTHYVHEVFGSVFAVTVTEGELKKGDKIIISVSDRDGGVRVQTYLKPKAYFPTLIDRDGDNIYYPISYARTPYVRVKSGPAARLRMVSPMVTTNGEEFKVKVRALDENYNPLETAYTGPVKLTITGPDGTTRALDNNASDSLAIFAVAVDTPGYYILTASAQGLKPVNLVVKATVDANAPKLYWGSIHGHTVISDGEFTPDEYYEYGRNVGMLDFCAISDHDWELAEHERSRAFGGFGHLQEVTMKYNIPGEYLTISGYEWMGPDGHVNVYFNNNRTDNPMYIGHTSVVSQQQAQTLAELVELYKDVQDSIIIPHSSHGFRWKTYDRRLMPVDEIYSCWGCSEYKLYREGEGVQAALKQGMRFGFIGGADSHHGSPGHTGQPSKYHILPCREGFAAVYASSLDRNDIFTGLRTRNCYATTAERILMEFNINEAPMGSEITIGKGSVLFCRGTVGGTAAIEKLELIMDGEVIANKHGTGLIEHFDYECEADGKPHYYYLRATQTNGEKAWSSPVWVDPA